MPYTVVENCEGCPKSRPFGVVKVGGSKPLGCHETAKKAGAQIGAIERSEGKKEMLTAKEVTNALLDGEQLSFLGEESECQDCPEEGKELFVADSSGRVIDSNDFVPWGATSFKEFEEVRVAREAAEKIKKDSNVFKSLVDNILGDERVSDKIGKIESLASEFGGRIRSMAQSKEKTCKTEGGVCYPSSDFAYVPDASKPSTWKLRLAAGKPGNVTVAQLGRAAAAFSKGGFRGNRVQIPSSAVGAVKRKIRAAYRRLGVKAEDIPDSVKEVSLFNVFYSKERDLYLFLVPYSNNILDHDLPKPEIIASKSHERFVELVDSGKVPLPEVWLWHIPSLKIGETEVVTYDKETGVAMAAGYFYEEANPIAEVIAENPELWGVSHSMDGNTIKKEVYDDKNVIVEHITFEISPLPRFAAANKWAPGFRIVKEISMSIPKAKREQLNGLGITDEMLEAVEDDNKTLSEAVKNLGVPTKEVSEEEVPVEESPVEEKPVEDAPEEAPEEAPEFETELEDAPAEEAPAEEVPAEEDAPAEEPAEGAFTEEQTKQLVDAFKTFGDQLAGSIIAQVKEVVAPALKNTEEKAKEMLHNAPPATLQDILLGGGALKKQSATIAQETLIDGRLSLAKDKPAEKSDKPLLVHSGSVLVDGVINDILQPDEPVQ